MQPGSSMKFLLGSEAVLAALPQQKVRAVFSKQAMDFLAEVSQRILRGKAARAYSDIMTLAFWCRRGNLEQLKQQYDRHRFFQGRGIAFHVAPSNVPATFFYSFIPSVLAGNTNIVRLPSKEFPQVEILCQAMRETLREMPAMAKEMVMIRYGHEKEINDYLSSLCSLRVIWGGNATIGELRASPLRPRATEITFADRYSLAVIDAEAYLASPADEKENITQGFYNDTYLSDQAACVSPRIVIWLGKNTKPARKAFWSRLRAWVDKRYPLEPVQAVNKLLKMYLLGAHKEARFIPSADNKIFRVEVAALEADLMEYKENSGFFMEYTAEKLADILPICDNEACQTLSYYGVAKEALREFMTMHHPQGVDRIVPLGRTMEFSLVWDGVDLIRAMAREVDLV